MSGVGTVAKAGAPVVHVNPVEGGASLLLAWRVKERHVLVVGGGPVATGRVRRALEADARVTVVAPTIAIELRIRQERGEIDWRARDFFSSDLDDAEMVLTAIDDPETSQYIFQMCRARRIPVNVADVPEECDFWFTSVHRRGPVQVAVSSNGRGPAIAARLTREIGAELDDELEDAVAGFFSLRQAIRRADSGPEASKRRMAWLTEVGRTWSYEELAALDATEVERLVADYLRGSPARTAREVGEVPVSHPKRSGRVTLVGAGPGDAEMLTVGAVRALEEADIVFADRLIPQAILALVQGKLRFARKLPGRSDIAQAEMDQEVLEAVQSGLHVARLKQGDPMVFGRGGEELLFFAEHDITAEVVPGISSALAGPLLAGVPPTHRGLAHRLVIMTGQTRGGGWTEVPTFDPEATVILLMAVGRAGRLAEQMMAKGYPADWPTMVVERAGQPEQQSLHSTLTSLGPDIQHHAVRAPAVIVVGQVAGFPKRLAEANTPRASVVGGDA